MMEINADLKNLDLRSHRLEKQPIFVLQYWITIETDVEILALDGYKVQKEKLLKRIDFAFRFLFCKERRFWASQSQSEEHLQPDTAPDELVLCLMQV